MDINNSLSDTSRVWIYQSNRPFDEKEIETLTKELKEFAKEWASHSRQLNADAFVLFDRFIALMVDENMIGASGCSIDTSVRFLKKIEQTYHINLFDRFLFSYLDTENKLQTVDSNTFAANYKEGKISENSLICDTLVDTKSKLKSSFLVPIHQSWHKRFI